MKIFDWINEIRIGKRNWNFFSESDQKQFQPYIINRFLSMDKDLILIVNYFQKYSIGLLEPKQVYKWYCEIVPKGKRWLKYIKGSKLTNYEPWVIETIKTHFEISQQECIKYLDLLYQTKNGKQYLQDILKMYGIDPAKIKKVNL